MLDLDEINFFCIFIQLILSLIYRKPNIIFLKDIRNMRPSYKEDEVSASTAFHRSNYNLSGYNNYKLLGNL